MAIQLFFRIVFASEKPPRFFKNIEGFLVFQCCVPYRKSVGFLKNSDARNRSRGPKITFFGIMGQVRVYLLFVKKPTVFLANWDIFGFQFRKRIFESKWLYFRYGDTFQSILKKKINN